MTIDGFLTENRHSKCVGLYFNKEKAKLSFQLVSKCSDKPFSSLIKGKNTKPFSHFLHYIGIREGEDDCWYVSTDPNPDPDCAFVGTRVNDNGFSDLI